MKRIVCIILALLCVAPLIFGLPQKEKTSYNFGGSTTVLPIIECKMANKE